MFYLIFCRSVWYYPLRLDNPLYYEVVFNQIAPDYLEGLLLVTPGEQLQQEVIVSHLIFITFEETYYIIAMNLTLYEYDTEALH